MKVIILKGIQASGKSTWAKAKIAEDPSFVRINKDEIRILLGTDGKPCGNEKMVCNYRDDFIKESLSNGLNVIVDDTNFNPFHEETIRNIASAYSATVEIKWFKIPLKEAIERDSKREGSARIGKFAIINTYNKYKDIIEAN